MIEQCHAVPTASTTECGQTGRGVEHVEVFRTVSVRTFILENLDVYLGNRNATPSPAKNHLVPPRERSVISIAHLCNERLLHLARFRCCV